MPDNNATGIQGLINFNTSVVISRLSVDVNIEHSNMANLTITLTSPAPANKQVVLYNPAKGIGVNLVKNFPREILPAVGSMEDFYGLNAQGIWSLKVVDNVAGDIGRLVTWKLNVNEGFQNGDVFIGGKLNVDGKVEVRNDIDVRMGGRSIFMMLME